MNPDRSRLPDKAEIAIFADVDALTDWLDYAENRAIDIQTQLETRSDDGATDEWERRAQGALIAHRICAKNLRAEIHRRRLGVKGAAVAASEGKSQAKAANKATNELAAANALERKRQATEAMRLASFQAARKLIDKIDYARLWQACAHELLSPEQCRAISDLASLRHREALSAAIDEAAA